MMGDVLSSSVVPPELPGLHIPRQQRYTPQCTLSTSPDRRCSSSFSAHSSSTGVQAPVNLDPDHLPAPHPSLVARHLHPITLEHAAAQHGLTVTRRMQHRLTPAQFSLLRSALSYSPSADRTDYECDELANRLCTEGVVNKCALYQAGDNPHHIGLIATDHLRTGEPIGAVMGCLRPAEHLHDPTLPLGSLKRVFYYSIDTRHLGQEYKRIGGMPLMVDMQTGCNELRFMRAVCEECVEEDKAKEAVQCEAHSGDVIDVSVINVCTSSFRSKAANVEERVILHPNFALPFILLIALCPIRKGTELLVKWRDEHRTLYVQYVLTMHAKAGWQLHRELALLQRVIREADCPAACPPPTPPPPSCHLVIVSTEEAFRRSGAVHTTTMCYDAMDSDTYHEIHDKAQKRIAQHIEAQQSDAHHDGQHSSSKGRSSSKPPVLSHLPEHVSRLTPTEVVSCLHPARFFAAPDHPAFAAVFNCDLEPGQPVCLYTGECMKEGQEALTTSDRYSWEIKRGPLQLPFDLVVHADRKGSAARFVNDSVFRKVRNCANVHPVAFIDQHTAMPSLLIETSCEAHAGEEAICEYGDGQHQ